MIKKIWKGALVLGLAAGVCLVEGQPVFSYTWTAVYEAGYISQADYDLALDSWAKASEYYNTYISDNPENIDFLVESLQQSLNDSGLGHLDAHAYKSYILDNDLDGWMDYYTEGAPLSEYTSELPLEPGTPTEPSPEPVDPEPQPEEETPAEATITQTLRASVSVVTDMISGRISQLISPKRIAMLQGTETGLAAGDTASGLAVWANISYTDFADSKAATESESNFSMAMLGMDYRLNDNMVVGCVMGYEDTESKTRYNAGWIDTDGLTIGPYFAWLINENFSIDLSAGYSWLESDQLRNSTVSSDFDSERYFYSANLHGYYDINNFNFVATVGYTFANNDADSYTENNGNRVASLDTDLGTIGVGGEVAYNGDHIQPYVNATYNYDTEYDDYGNSYDRDAVNVGIGFRVQITESLTGDFQASSMLGRSSQEETSLMANVRYAF